MTAPQTAQTLDLCRAEDAVFQSHFEYRTILPLDQVLHNQFFLPLRNNLQPGDQIVICRYDKSWKRWGNHREMRLLAVVTVRVIAVSNKAVELTAMGPILTVPEPVKTDEEIAAEAEAAVPKPEYVKENCRVQWNVGSQTWDVLQKSDGALVARVKQGDGAKGEALRIANGEDPIPAPEKKAEAA